jgi:hypothetical protein
MLLMLKLVIFIGRSTQARVGLTAKTAVFADASASVTETDLDRLSLLPDAASVRFIAFASDMFTSDGIIRPDGLL